MPHSAVQRRFTPVHEVPFVPRDRLLSARWTGFLEVELTFSSKHPLIIGAGWPTLDEKSATAKRRGPILKPKGKSLQGRMRDQRLQEEAQQEEQQLVSEVVRGWPGGPPVIPGSSLKGAVRQVFELLTHSCEPDPDTGCDVTGSEPELCPACSLFGGFGTAGRLSFGEGRLLPAKTQRRGWERQMKKVEVPIAWKPQKPVSGTVRVYGSGPDRDKQGHLRPEVEMIWSVWGSFRNRLRILNASDQELGLLFASLGVGWEGDGPQLRLGGKKYHGYGGGQVRIAAAQRRQGFGRKRTLPEPEAWARELCAYALDKSDARKVVWENFHHALAKER